MNILTPDVMRWLSNHHGVITADQMRALGISRRVWGRMAALELFVPMRKGVYRIASSPATLFAECVALCAAHPSGFITGPTGGRISGLRRMPVVGGLHLAMPHGRAAQIDGVTVRQSNMIEPTDVQRRRDGINLASPWRLAFDLASDLEALDHQSVVEQILHTRLCTLPTLVATGRRLAVAGRPGAGRYLETLATRLVGGPLESHPEVVLAKALQRRGIPIEAQTTWLQLPSGRRARLDLSVPAIRWGIEIDAHFSHFLNEGVAKDRRRDRHAAQVGWRIDHVTPLDLLDLDGIVAELAVQYRLRANEVALLDRSVG